MAPPRGDTRDRMIGSAVRMLQRQGFVGTGLREVVEDCDAPRGSIYFHFPGGKEELGAEAVELWQRTTVGMVRRCAERAKDPGHLIDLCAQELARTMRRSGFVEGCPAAVTALEMAPGSDTLRAACDAMFAGWQEVLCEQLCGAGLSEDRGSELAAVAVSVLEGALILSRTGLSTRPLEIAGGEMAMLVKDAIAKEPGRRKGRRGARMSRLESPELRTA